MTSSELKQEDVEKVLAHSGLDLDRLIDDLSEDALRHQFILVNEELALWEEVPDGEDLAFILQSMREGTIKLESHFPVAEYLNEDYLAELDVDIEHLPEASLVPDTEAELNVIKEPAKPQASHAKTPKDEDLVEPAEQKPAVVTYESHSTVSRGDSSRVSVTEVTPQTTQSASREFKANRSLVEILEQEEIQPHHTARTTTTSDRNKGLDPSSPKYIRGVLHRNADRMVQGTSAFILVLVLCGLSVLPVLYAFFWSDYYYALLCPALLFIAACLQFTVVRYSSCPVCRQRQYVTKRCAKHERAHYSPVLGHRIPTAIHLTRFKWFRCIYCGTAVRVKE